MNHQISGPLSKVKYAITFACLILIGFNGYAQRRPIIGDDDDFPVSTSVTITGSASASVNSTKTYTVRANGGFHSSSNYQVSGGTITSQNKTSVSVRWTSAGSGRWIRVNANVSGQLRSATKYVSVTAPLAGGNISASTATSICSGTDPGTINNSSSASGGSGSFSYQWQILSSGGPGLIENDGLPIDGGGGQLTWTNVNGARSSSYNPPKLYAATSYRRRVTSGGQTSYSNTISYSISEVTAGSISYSGGNVNAGGNPSKITGTTVSGASYQWQRKTTGGYSNISGATGREYDPGTQNVTTRYRRRVIKCGQTKYSNEIMIRVNLHAGAIAVSTATTICYSGNPGTINNSTSPKGGTGSFSYQWQQSVYSGGSYGSFTNISGATSSTYNPPALNANRRYRRRVQSDGQTKYTSYITYTVRSNLNQGSISYLGGTTISPGSNPSTISGSTPAGGTGSYTYQWEKKTTGGYSNISGATGKSYDPGSLNVTTTFRRRVASCQTKYTNEIKFTVSLTGGTITASTGTSICSGSDPGAINNSVSPKGGTGSYSYQWQQLSSLTLDGPSGGEETIDGGLGGNGWTNVSGATGSTYNPPSVSQAKSYRRKVTSGGQTAYSNTVSYSISAVSAGSISYSGGNINHGGNPSKITGTTVSGASYQWQRKTTGGYSNISGATGREYDPGTQNVTTRYRRRVVKCSQTKYSNEITIRVNLHAGAITASTATTICYNGNPSTISNGTSPKGGTGSFSYQWQHRVYSNGAYGGWSNVSGATGSAYNPPALTSHRKYRRRVQSDGQSKYTGEITYTVRSNLNQGSISYSGSRAINPGGNPSTISGSTPTGGTGSYSYQWEKKTTGGYTSVSGATGKSYDPGSLNVTTTYRRRVASCQTKYTNEIKFTVNLIGGTVTASTGTSICSGSDPGIINSTASGAGGVGSHSYQWQYLVGEGIEPTDQTIDQIDDGDGLGPIGFNWQNITGATSATFNPPALTTNKTYRRKVSSGSEEAYSNVINYTIAAAVNKGSISYSGSAVNPGSTPTKISGTSATGGTGISYRWQWKRGTETSFTNIPSDLGSSVTSRDYQPQGLNTNTIFRRRVSSCGQNHYTNQVVVNVNLIAGSISGNQTICAGSDPSNISSSSLASGGNGSYNYKWEKREYKPTQISPIDSGPGDQEIIDDGNGGGIDSPIDTEIVYVWTGWTETASGTSHNPGPISYKTEYRRKVTSNGISRNTSTVTKNVYDLIDPTTISYPGGSINSGGTPAKISGEAATGGTSISYQWIKRTTGGYSNIIGATNREHQPAPLINTTTFQRLAISNCGDTKASNEVTITVNLHPGTIASGSETICRASDPTVINSMSPASGGLGNYNYQWQVRTELGPDSDGGPQTLDDGIDGELTGDSWFDIPGETNETFDPSILYTNTTYRRRVKAGSAEAFTAAKMYTVADPLAAGSINYSGGVVNANGNPPSITGTSATGGISPDYQWQRKVGNAANFSNISGATNRDYNPPSGIQFTTVYKRRVKSCGETKYTSPVTINVNFSAGSISGNQVICVGGDPDIISSTSAAKGGMGGFDYQWQRNVYQPVDIGPIEQTGDSETIEGGGSTIAIDSPIEYQWSGWQNIAGQKSVSLNLSTQTFVTQYRRRVVSGGVTKQSNVVTIDIEELPEPGTITYSGGTITAGTNAAQIVGSDVTSVFNIQYKWMKKVNGGFVVVPNSNTRNLNPGQLDFSTTYIRLIENDCGQVVESNTVKVPVRLVAGNTSTTSFNVCHDCARPTLSPAGSIGGSGQYSYQWQIEGSVLIESNNQTIEDVNQLPIPVGETEFTDIGFAKDAEYKPEMLWIGTRTFRRKVTSDGQVSYSQPISITIYPALNPGIITYNSADPCQGNNVGTISGASASGGNDNYEFQWQYYNGSGWITFSNSDSESFNPDFTLNSDTKFRRRVRSAGSTWKKSNEITISIYDIITNIGSLSATTDMICDGSIVNFSYSPAENVDTDKTRLYGSKEGVEKDFGVIKSVLSIRVNQGYNYYVKYLQRCTPTRYQSNNVSLNYFENCNLPPSLDQNFVRVEVPKVPIKLEHELGALGPQDRSVTYSYNDGLGRPTMTVAVQAGQDYEDLIQFNEFDDNGRITKNYMPYYTKSENPGEFLELDQNKGLQKTFYEDSKYGADSYAYSLSSFDERGRVISVVAPGENYQGKSTETFTDIYDPSLFDETDDSKLLHDLVGHWAIQDGKPVNDGAYEAKELTVSMVKDLEGKLTRQVTDGRGLSITSQLYDSDLQKWIGSYNVYDKLGRLRFIVPPVITQNLNNREPIRISNEEFQELIFEYTYDNRGRLFKERAPGSGWTYYLYDKWDRVVLKRHDEQVKVIDESSTLPAWTFYKYDALNRLVISGQFGTQLSLSELSEKAKTSGIRYETTSDGSIGYTVTRSFPEFGSRGLGNNYLLETINYYDNYNFITSGWGNSDLSLNVPDDFDGFGWAPPNYTLVTENLVIENKGLISIEGEEGPTGTLTVNGKYATRPGVTVTLGQNVVAGPEFEVIDANEPFTQVVDLTTGSKVRVLGTDDWLHSVIYYDERGRVIQSVGENHKEGVDRISSEIDWKGELQKMLLEHSSYEGDSFDEGVQVLSEYQYAHNGQVEEVYQTINKTNQNGVETVSGDRVLVADYNYNVLGELIEKNLHSEDGVSFLQSVDYSYNLQRSLTKINDPNKLGGLDNDLFGMKYYYEEGIDVEGVSVEGRYDGMVSAIEWKASNATPTIVPTDGPKGTNKYAILFDYDQRNRLNATNYASAPTGQRLAPDSDQFNISVDQYDDNGNIMKLSREEEGNKIDDLTYDYYSNSNKLRRVTDAEDSEKGFKDKQSSATDWEYQYNDMGNMTADLNKGIASIEYNHLQLVTQIEFDDEVKIKYTYDAVGNRLSKAVIDADENEIARVDYMGLIEYLDDDINQIFTEEGRAYAQNGEFHYEYFIKDIQGNNRMAFGELPDRNIYTASMEAKNKSYEESEFAFPNQAIRTDRENHTPLGDSSIYLNGTVGNRRLGLAKVLSIESGDEVEIEAWAKYTPATGSGPPLGDIVNTVMTAFGAVPSDGGSGEALSNAIAEGGPGAYLPISDPGDPNDAPDAYIAYLFFNENNEFVPAYSSFIPVGDDSFERFSKLEMDSKMRINQQGSLLIYMANETDENQEVYFDDLKIIHSSGEQSFRVSQVNDYYPFGMATSASWKAKGYIDPGLLYQSSFSTLDSLTGYYDFLSRNYDPALGRFFAVDPAASVMPYNSPYAGMMNAPNVYVDPNGECPVCWAVGTAIVGALVPAATQALVQTLNGEGSFSDNLINNGISFGGGFTPGSSFSNGGYIAGGTLATGGPGYGYSGLDLNPIPNVYEMDGSIRDPSIYSPWAGEWVSASEVVAWDPTNQRSSYRQEAVDALYQYNNDEWDYSSFASATAFSLILLGDDVTGVGVVDDVLIPVAYAAAAVWFTYENRDLIAKKTREVERILAKAAGPPGFQYSLRATVPGYYPDVRTGVKWLDTGEVWKYGETTQGMTRYSQSYLDGIGAGVTMVPEFFGTQVEIKVAEKTKIYGYYFRNGTLPPGNKIFR
ncbi:DUF6443 domain-containing protein [Ekhidna sp.]